MPGEGLAIAQLVMSTIQTCFLAYLAARYKTPWDIPIDAPRSSKRKAGTGG